MAKIEETTEEETTEEEASKEDIEAFQKIVKDMKPEELKPLFEVWAMLNRALDGQPIEPEQVFSGLLNIKDIRERTRFPSIIDVKRHVFLRMFAKTMPEAKAFGDWAEEEAKHLISYPKGEGRKEGVEIMKSKGMIAQGIAPVFMGSPALTEPQKQGRLSRIKSKISGGPKEE